MDEVRQLRLEFLEAGGTAEAFEACGRGYLSLADSGWQDGSLRPAECKAMAEQKTRPGVLIEYHCYDSRGRDQGVSLLAFESWTSMGALQFKAKHLVASDGYYEYWATHLMKDSKVIYHFCMATRARCRVPQGPEEVMVHITKWRLVSPQTLIGEGYGSDVGLAHLKELLNQALLVAGPVPPPPAPPVAPPGGHQSGLDAALRLEEPPGPLQGGLDELMEEAQRKKKDRPKTVRDPEKSGRGNFGQTLVRRVKARGAELQEEEAKRKKKRKHKADDDVGLRKRKAQRVDETSSESSSCSSEPEPVFQNASTREVDLVNLSKKNPGCLLKSALKEMSRYLSARGEAVGNDPAEGKVVSYLHQVLLPQHPKAGLRAQRELMTLGSALDLLLAGEVGRAADLLVQRFKAIEGSLAADGNWSVARHMELIPGQASLSTQAEMSGAAKAELRALKLRQQLQKSTK